MLQSTNDSVAKPLTVPTGIITVHFLSLNRVFEVVRKKMIVSLLLSQLSISTAYLALAESINWNLWNKMMLPFFHAEGDEVDI